MVENQSSNLELQPQDVTTGRLPEIGNAETFGKDQAVKRHGDDRLAFRHVMQQFQRFVMHIKESHTGLTTSPGDMRLQ